MSPLADDFGDPRAFIAGSPIQTGSLYWADKIAPYVKNNGDSGLSTGRGTDNYGAAQRCPDVAGWFDGHAKWIRTGEDPCRLERGLREVPSTP